MRQSERLRNMSKVNNIALLKLKFFKESAFGITPEVVATELDFHLPETAYQELSSLRKAIERV